MAKQQQDGPIRVINDDTTEQEMQEGHRIPNADPPKNEAARGGFGNREGKEGYGNDSSNGITAISVNADAERGYPGDNIRAVVGDEDRANQDLPNPDLDDDSAEGDAASMRPRGPVDELDADDYRKGPDEMSNPNSRVGMGQMEPRQFPPVTGTDTNAELTDPGASDTAIDQ